MRPFSAFALMMFATPALAHDAPLAHAHAEYALPAGIALIVLAGLAAMARK